MFGGLTIQVLVNMVSRAVKSVDKAIVVRAFGLCGIFPSGVVVDKSCYNDTLKKVLDAGSNGLEEQDVEELNEEDEEVEGVHENDYDDESDSDVE